MQQKLIIYILYSVCCLETVIFCLESCVCGLWSSNGPSTNVEDSLQINPFLRNKPNFQNAQMNLSLYPKTAYENKSAFGREQNKPNSNPNKPNLKRAKMNVNLYFIEDYRKKDDFVVRINKPNLLRRRRITLIVFEVLLIVLAVLLPFIIEFKLNVATPVVIRITLPVIALLIIGLLAYLSSRTEQQKRD